MSSSALASARKRRSNAESPPIPETAGRPGSAPGTGLTIQQVVAVVDKRLLVLEGFMTETRSKPFNTLSSVSEQAAVDLPTNLKEVLEEYGSRFDIIADEIANIKNMMLSLQSFTMDVNKKLMEERIRILSNDDEPLTERALELSLDN